MTTTNTFKISCDSGQFIIIDPCYLLDDTGTEQEKYEAICDLTLSTKGFGEILGGFAFGTPYGDGVYAVEAELDANGKIVRLSIELEDAIDDEDEPHWLHPDTDDDEED